MNKRFLAKIFGAFCIMVMLVTTCAFAKNSDGIKFYKNSFSMNLGDIQLISGIIDLEKIDISNLTSSDPSVVAIRDGNKLKALSTGLATISYTYNKDGETKEVWCHIEVTTGNSTFAPIVQDTAVKIKITLELGDSTTVIESAKAAIPRYPEVKKPGYIFAGWYKDSNLMYKVGDRERFNTNTTLYAKWITEEEVNKPTVQPSRLYDDITNHWARSYIESVTDLGLFNGVAERMFGPDRTMTRAMVITVLGRLEEVKLTGRTTEFTDVPAGAYYEEYVAWGVENKIVSGISATEFLPNKEITREEVAVMVANYIKYKKYPYEEKDMNFTDGNQISSWAVDSVKILNSLEIMEGNDDGAYNPKKVATRAEIATVFFRYFNYINRI